jgi:hypothetical protein
MTTNQTGLKSKCCQADMSIGGDDIEGTHYYVCDKCKQMTDPDYRDQLEKDREFKKFTGFNPLYIVVADDKGKIHNLAWAIVEDFLAAKDRVTRSEIRQEKLDILGAEMEDFFDYACSHLGILTNQESKDILRELSIRSFDLGKIRDHRSAALVRKAIRARTI